MLAAVSMLSVDSIFYAPRDKVQEVMFFPNEVASTWATKNICKSEN